MRRFPRAAQQHFEALEPRRLQSAAPATPTAGDGHDYVILAPDAGKPVVRAVAEQVKRAPLKNGFTWFDGTARDGLTNSIPGVAKIDIDDRNVFPIDANGNIVVGDAIDEKNTRAMARRAAARSGVLTLDLENWTLYLSRIGQAQANRYLARFEQIVDWCKDEVPTLKIGLYGEMPSRDLYSSSQWSWTQDIYETQGSDWHANYIATAAQNYAQWQASAAFVAPLAAKCDYLFPSLYTYYDDADQWTRMARATIDTARTFGKPVIPYLWHTYHPGVPLGGTALADADWARELDLMRECADGAVIWNDPGEAYDNSMGWIKAIAARQTTGPGKQSVSAASSVEADASSTPRDDDASSRVDDLLAA